jgi:hypothetical protein
VAGSPFFHLRGACPQRRVGVPAHMCLEQPDAGNCKPWKPLADRALRERRRVCPSYVRGARRRASRL